VQLLPTWELKQLSQRADAGPQHDPGYGHLPPWYLSQIFLPWVWYSDDVDPDQALQSIHMWSIASNTNKVEAHLYFGLLPLMLAASRLGAAVRGTAPLEARQRLWGGLGLLAMVYATGWLLPVTRHWPGFGFFMGPGRYGIVTTLSVALLAGSGLDRWLHRRRPLARGLWFAVVMTVTLADLFWVSRRVTYATMVTDPPLAHRDDSDVRRLLEEYQTAGPHLRPVRMLAPGPNLPTLSGFSATPPYLGLSPAAYYDPDLAIPAVDPQMSASEWSRGVAIRAEWLKQAGVTHILSMELLDPEEWPGARLVWQGFDRLLNPAWGRFQQPLWLYELDSALRRVWLVDPRPDDRLAVLAMDPDRLQVQVETGRAGELVAAELAYPGWEATIDGQPSATLSRGAFRSVRVPPGRHVVEWRFQSRTIRWGALVSGATACCWVAAAGFCLRGGAARTFTATGDAGPTSG
jgi:hypothetical protein